MPKVPSFYGAIDSSGELVLPRKFKHLGDFSDGLAVATVDGTHFGYVNSIGEFVIQPTIIGVPDSFSDGVAAIGRAPEVNL